MEDFTQLGVAEQAVAKRFQNTSETILKHSQEFVKWSTKLTEVDWDEVMLDSEKKNHIVPHLEHLEKLANNLAMSVMIPMIIAMVAEPKEKA